MPKVTALLISLRGKQRLLLNYRVGGEKKNKSAGGGTGCPLKTENPTVECLLDIPDRSVWVLQGAEREDRGSVQLLRAFGGAAGAESRCTKLREFK